MDQALFSNRGLQLSPLHRSGGFKWVGSNLSARGVEAQSRIPQLTELSIGSRRCDDSGLTALKDCAALKVFATANCNIFTDEAFGHISQVPGLVSLTNMYIRGGTTDKSTEYMADMATLRDYSVWESRITDVSCEMLAGMTNLESLLLYRCPAVTERGIEMLAKSGELRKLDLQLMPQLDPQIGSAFRAHVSINFHT